jgi:hypothetical protein
MSHLEKHNPYHFTKFIYLYISKTFKTTQYIFLGPLFKLKGSLRGLRMDNFIKRMDVLR